MICKVPGAPLASLIKPALLVSTTKSLVVVLILAKVLSMTEPISTTKMAKDGMKLEEQRSSNNKSGGVVVIDNEG